MDKYIESLTEKAVYFAPKILLALVTLLIGLWVISLIRKFVCKRMEARGVEVTVQNFVGSLVGILLKVALVVSVAQIVGIATTSFVAILGAAGLAIGLALQGSLSNFAGGVLLILFKPYKVGDFIEAQGFAGVVEDIQVFNTMMRSGDNKVIIVPNGPMAGGSIVNYSVKSTRRVDMLFGIGYDDDIDKAKGVLQSMLESDERVLKDPAIFIAVKELADSSVNLVVRAWVNSGDYWGLYHDMQENVKKRFDAEGIGIPYPHRELYVHQVEK